MVDLVTLEEVVILFGTEEAYRIGYNGMICWIPKSQIDNLEEVNAAVTYAAELPIEMEELIIPEWLARSKDLI